jgi:hypothetical protein
MLLLNPKATLVFIDLLCGGCHPLRVTLIFSVSRSVFGWTRTETVLVSKKGGGVSEGFGLKSVGSESFGFEKFGFEKCWVQKVLVPKILVRNNVWFL